MPRYLRSLNNNVIFDWNPILADNPVCVELSEEEAFPERFLKPEVVQQVEEKRKKRGRPPLSLGTDDIPEAPVYTPPELAAEAAKGFPT